jgi:2-amino-4-hydroxy-6-hydroxymethyldihydropteridine diphosphokinase
MNVLAGIGLGSNLAGPAAQLATAFAALAQLPGTRLLAQSPLYASPPLGPPDQPDYINAAALLATDLSAQELLQALLLIEQNQGRVRAGLRWGPRTLDLDLLFHGAARISEPGLEVPHPHIAARRFVLQPLHDIAPAQEIPGLGRVDFLLAACPPYPLRRL